MLISFWQQLDQEQEDNLGQQKRRFQNQQFEQQCVINKGTSYIVFFFSFFFPVGIDYQEVVFPTHAKQSIKLPFRMLTNVAFHHDNNTHYILHFRISDSMVPLTVSLDPFFPYLPNPMLKMSVIMPQWFLLKDLHQPLQLPFENLIFYNEILLGTQIWQWCLC